jgi:hypothetical protein
MRCQRFGGATRREEGEYPLWIFADVQRSRIGKDRQPAARLTSRPSDLTALIPFYEMSSNAKFR